MAMQQNKDIKNICTLNNDQQENAYNLFETLLKMKIARIGRFFNSVKRCGVNVSDIIMLLVLMPFHHISSIPMLVKSGMGENQGVNCGNSVYYDLKNNAKVNWRSLLYLVALRFKHLGEELNMKMVNKTRAFIVDDSPLQKSGIKIELVSRVHDHVSGEFIFGYKILVLGYWDGFSFYPLDFSLHREKGNQADEVKKRLDTANRRVSVQRKVKKEYAKILTEAERSLILVKKQNKGKQTKAAIKQIETAKNKVKRARKKYKAEETKYVELTNMATELRAELKETRKRHPNYGLTKKQMNSQYKKYRDANTPGAQRVAEADMKKTTSMLAMLKRAVKRKFIPDYVLTDSWFFNQALVRAVSKLTKRHKINLISMAKMNTTKYKLMANNKYYNAAELLIKLERQAVTARSHKAKYIKVAVSFGDIRVNLFFIKIGQASSWKLLVTNDLTINFQKLMEVYQIRWSIEIFFRESKQYLNLGKSKSTCFDAQIADATISLTQYTILSFHQRITEYGSFDGVFASALEDAMQNSIAAELQKMFLILVEMFCEMAGIDIIELTGSVIKNEQVSKKIINLNPIFYQKLEKHHAA
jgi:hypothetical protein